MTTVDIFDDYLSGHLNEAGRSEFERRLTVDPVFAQAFAEHRHLIDAMTMQANRETLHKKLQTIHREEFGIHAKTIPLSVQAFVGKHGRTIAVAASAAIIAVLSTVTLLSTGGYLLKKQGNEITELKRYVRDLRYSNEAIVENITKNNNKRTSYAPANLEGSAFALNNRGYLITSFHMVNGADSIFIRNNSTERTLATLVYSDPAYDLAVLKLDDEETTLGWQVPFTLKEKASDIGETVFTLGYPRREMVYGEGSLSSLSGFSNDSNMYQISIPVNPGNSGGPVLDETGNIIGVIRGKISGADAAGFAIKSNEILQSLRSIENDSLRQDLMATNVKKGSLRGLKRAEQVKRINPYVFNVLVYKGE